MARGKFSDDDTSRGGRNRLLKIFDFTIFVFTAAAAAALVCAYISRYVNPNDAWPLAFAGLGAPILYVVNIIFALYWTVRWKHYALLPIAVVLAGAGWISLFFRPTLRQHYPGTEPKAQVVMSYNVAGFLTESNGRMVSALDSVAAFVGRERPDILCIQEFQCNSAELKPHMDSLIGLPHNRVNYKVTNASGGGWGLAIYSNYAIIRSGSVDFEQTTNSALWADLSVKGDTVRIFNCHLQTTSIDRSDREYLTDQEFTADGTREERVRSILGKLRRNFRIRADQADSLAHMIRRSPHPVIVCGDFNDTPMSYAYRTIRADLADAFVEKGTGIPSTYQGLFNLFRIDYVLHSREITTVGYLSPPGKYSDHKAVIAKLDI